MDEQTKQLIKDVLPHVTKIRHDIHENPELGFQERETTKLIRAELEKNGVEIIPIELETGVLAIIRGKAEWKGIGKAPVIGIRADIDALPIEEKTGKPYSSRKPGVMHACGHDGHTANLLGTAIVLQKLSDNFAGTVKLFFQPAEETLYGAQKMLACNVLENPDVDKVIAFHGDVAIPIGTIGVYPGAFMASSDVFKIKVVGVGTHGATPFRGTDALSAAAQMVLSLQMVLAREIDANDRAVISVCQLHSGDAFNIVPGEANVAGTVRCHSETVREYIEQRINSICESIALSYRCEVKTEYIYGLPATVNDSTVIEEIIEAAEKAIGVKNVTRLQVPLMGSEDFSLFTQRIPGAIFRVGVSDGLPISLHNPGFDFPDKALETALPVFVQYILDQLS